MANPGDSQESASFALDGWSDDDRASLLAALDTADIPHRWDGDLLWVPAEDEGWTLELIAVESRMSTPELTRADWEPELDLRPRDPLAGPWLRLGGLWIDGLIFLPLQIPLFIAARSGGSGVYVALFLARWALDGAYLTLLPWRYGQTLGMRVMSTRLVRWDEGGRPSLLATFKRWAVVGAINLSILLPVVGRLTPVASLAVYLPIIFRRDHRGLHDMFSGTTVVRNNFDGAPAALGR